MQHRESETTDGGSAAGVAETEQVSKGQRWGREFELSVVKKATVDIGGWLPRVGLIDFF